MQYRATKKVRNPKIYGRALNFAIAYFSETANNWSEFVAYKNSPPKGQTIEYTEEYPCGIVTIPDSSFSGNTLSVKLAYHNSRFSIVKTFAETRKSAKRFTFWMNPFQNTKLVSGNQIVAYTTRIQGLEGLNHSLCEFESRFEQCPNRSENMCTLFNTVVGSGFSGSRCSACLSHMKEF